MTAPDSSPSLRRDASGPARWGTCAAVAGIWLIFSAWSFCRVPIPGVNEPHYLAKARHWWNPAWCPGDPFLDSSNPHLVFYALFGWLTTWLDFHTVAIISRLIGLLVLSIGWHRLAGTVTGRSIAGLLAAPVFLFLQTLGNFSGEWLVGGIESKVLAYGFLFWALGLALQQSGLKAGLLAGLAVSFHPLVGIWGLIAFSLALIREWESRRRSPAVDGNLLPVRTPVRQIVPGILACLLVSLPGVISAVATLKSLAPKLDLIATQLQVGDRLAHHLDPMRFPKSAYVYWGGMILVWRLLLLLRSLLSPEASRVQQQRQLRWQLFVGAAIVIALVGVAVGYGPRPLSQMPGMAWRSWLLKFYPFRLGDLLVPVALSFTTVSVLLALWHIGTVQNRSLVHHARLAALWLIMALAGFSIPFPDENPSRLSPAEQADWIAACHWLRDHTPPEALVYACDSGWAVKWFAERPEYVNFKDMPQDTPALIDWNRRLWTIADWRIAAMSDNAVQPKELVELRKKTGIDYLLVGRFGPIQARPVYQGTHFRIIRTIPAATAESP